MTDYRPLLSRAIAALEPNTGEARRAIYDRARTALVNQLRGINPPLAEAEITRQRLSLEDAIRKVESEATAPAAAAPPPRGERTPRPEQPGRGEQAPRTAPPAASSRPANDMRVQDREPAFDEQDQFEPEAPRDPRAPRGPQGRPDPSLRPRAVRGRSPADYARDDARKASRTKFVVFGIIFVLLLLAGAVGYVHRDRILSIIAGANLGTQEADTPAQTPQQNKSSDRVPQQNQQAPVPSPLTQPTGASQRAVLFEENPGSQQFTTIGGTVSWRAETVNPGPGRSPELGIRVDVDIPERKMQVVLTIRRNQDVSIPATHFIEIQFVGNDSFGGVAQVPVVRMKTTESAQGIPLAGISHRVMQGFFLIGLSAADADRDRNIQILRTQSWLDIPFIYNNGRRAVIAFEKGSAGEKALAEAFAAWGG
jgi:hypothetical protein